MNATADLLSLAIVGYLFLYIFNYTRFYISQKSGYETLFLSIVSGCINIAFSQIVSYFGESKIAKRFIFQYSQSDMASRLESELGFIRFDDMAVAAVIAVALNICLRRWRLPILKRMGGDNLIAVRLQEKGEPVEIYTDMNRKYVGFVISAPAINSNRSGDVELLALSEIWINNNTGKEEGTDYFSLAESMVNEDKKRMDKIKAKVENEVREEFEKLERTVSSSDIEENYKKKALDRLRKEKREKETKRIDDEKRISIKRGLPRIIVPLAGIVTVKLAAWQ